MSGDGVAVSLFASTVVVVNECPCECIVICLEAAIRCEKYSIRNEMKIPAMRIAAVVAS